MRIQNTNRGRVNLYVRFIMCGCSETPGTVVIAVHNKCGRTALSGAPPDLSYRNPIGRLLILSYGTAISTSTSFQAGEPELRKAVAAEKNKNQQPGRETARAAKEFLWRCNDEWLVSQV